MAATGKNGEAFDSKPKIGVALGTGAARGLAHIGVLNALDDAGIPIEFMAGSSIGGLMAASYASGSIDRIVDFADGADWRQMTSHFDFNFPQQGLMEGRRWMELMDSFVAAEEFSELRIPICIIATELMSGREVRIMEGNLAHAMRASTSLPGIFNPYLLNDSLMVDGGISNPIPIDVVRDMGADIVIAVNLNTNLRERNERKKSFRSTQKVSRRSRLKARLNQSKAPPEWIPDSLEERYSDFRQSVRKSLLNWVRDEEEDKKRDVNIFDVITNSINIMEYQVTQNKLRSDPPDFLIEPELDHLNLLDYHEAEKTIGEGYKKMQEQILELKRAMESGGNSG